MPFGKPKDSSSTRKVTPPSPAYMDSKQFASFLSNLRDNRVSRPGGARPQPSPSSSFSSTVPREADRKDASRPSLGSASPQARAASQHQRTQSDDARPRVTRPSIGASVSSRYSTISGRDYYPERPTVTKPLRPDEVVPTHTYMERGMRWMEKEEAVSLRSAMEDMDLKDEAKPTSPSQAEDESRLYNAALDEAAELVYQHQNGIKPPEAGAPYRYNSHLRKNSYAHARTASIGRYGSDIGATGLARDGYRSVSGSSSGSDGRASMESSARPSLDGRRTSTESTKTRTYGSLNGNTRVASGSRRRSSMKRNISGEIQKPFSGDQIWEESDNDGAVPRPSAKPAPAALADSTLRLRTTVNSSAAQTVLESKLETEGASPVAVTPTKPLSRTEIHRNPPTQSRNPNYTTTVQRPLGPRASDDIPRKNGVEIRSDDIRQATSYTLGDRSKKLPTPSAVSDRPGRPIVSFDANWKAPDEAAADSIPEPSSRLSGGRPANHLEDRTETSKSRTQHERVEQQRRHQGQKPTPPVPSISITSDAEASSEANPRSSTSGSRGVPSFQVDGPEVAYTEAGMPQISVSSFDGPAVPQIAVIPDPGPAVPSIVLPGDHDDGTANSPVIITPDGAQPVAQNPKASARPLPVPSRARAQPSTEADPRSRSHWSAAPDSVSSRASRATATCHECRYPIEGRFVSLHGVPERFHPHCFTCYTCGTSLEALEISPEPDNFRKQRLDRIARRAVGEILPEEPGRTMGEDGDDRLRFYCHLDWHEAFAPKCKHCSTSIIGEHIVALGGEHFHYGHFFCAECGDPFEQGSTHIEKDGYAWCVKCQTKRTERRAPKCRACMKPVIGQYVQALGGEWHDECFRCMKCGSGFDDGQIFPVGLKVFCTACRMRDLKA